MTIERAVRIGTGRQAGSSRSTRLQRLRRHPSGFRGGCHNHERAQQRPRGHPAPRRQLEDLHLRWVRALDRCLHHRTVRERT